MKTKKRTLDLISFKEIIERSIATQKEIDNLAKDVNKGWWEKNREVMLQ